MEILPKRIYEILKDKGVSSIVHANSVRTSCEFLRNRCLMSLEAVDKLSTHAKPVKTDQAGGNYSIWNDIFADTVDIHQHSNRAHEDGPVLLELDIEIIKNTYTGKVWVTKSNPAKWQANLSHERRWFISANDLEDNFSYGSFEHMIAFRHCAGKVPILGHLKRIVLDDPRLQTSSQQVDYFSMAFGALQLAMREGGFDVPIEKRACSNGCGCLDNYKSRAVDTDRMFYL